jgi:holo-[acyl-carrier-protein] synthase
MKIGTDIVQISRIEASLEKFGDKFLARFLAEEEIATLSHRPESLRLLGGQRGDRQGSWMRDRKRTWVS